MNPKLWSGAVSSTLFHVCLTVCLLGSSLRAAIPSPPNFVVVTPGDASNVIEWSPVPGATSYHVKNASRRSGELLVVGESITATSWVHNELRNKRRTYYSVSAVNSAGESIESSRIEVTPSAPILDWLGSGTAVEKLATGMVFTEGPVWNPEAGGFLIFSDINANRLYQWSFDEGLKVFRNPSENANGNTLDLEGRLITCEHKTRRITLTQKDGTIETLIGSHDGNRFNSPNDAVVKSDGSIWFTDPTWGLTGRKEMDGQYVFRFDPDLGTSRLVARGFSQPNGLCFSPDESILYVAESSGPLNIRAFDVQDGGTLTGDRIFANPEGTPDGMRVDRLGRLFTAAADVFVHEKDGSQLARIDVPEIPTNLCFGGQNNEMMFITARTSLYGITRRPDLVVRSIHSFPEKPVHADTVSFRAIIKNQGTGPTPSGSRIRVEFIVEGVGTIVGTAEYNEALAAGASVFLTASLEQTNIAWNAPEGAHTIQATVNEDGEIPESVRGNNSRDSIFTVGPRSPLEASIEKTTGHFEIRLIGLPGERHQIQTTTDLITWIDWREFEISADPLVIASTESADGSAQLFYRSIKMTP